MPEAEVESGRIDRLERLIVKHRDPPTPERAQREQEVVGPYPAEVWMEVWIEKEVG